MYVSMNIKEKKRENAGESTFHLSVTAIAYSSTPDKRKRVKSLETVKV
jgi:hypothetical protein